MKKIKLLLDSLNLIFCSAGIAAFITIFCYLLQSMLPALTTWSIQNVIEAVYSSAESTTYVHYIIIAAAGYVLTYMTQTVMAVALNAGVFERSNAYCRSQLAEKSAKLDLLQYEDFDLINKQKRATDCAENEVFGMLFMLLLRSACYVVSVISVVWILAGYSLVAAIGALITAVPYFVVRLVRGKSMYRLEKAITPQKRELSYLYGLFAEKSSAKDIRLLNAGKYLSSKWENLQNELRDLLLAENKKELISTTVCECITVIGLLGAILLSLRNTILGVMSIGTFSACIYAFQNVQSTTFQFFSTVGTIPQQLAYADDYMTFLNVSERKAGQTREIHLDHGIALEHVSFCYPGSDRAVFNDLNLYIPAGKTIAVVGKNGSGKTTLSKLLIGIYPAEKGCVCWDGADLNELGVENIERFTAVVSQPLNKFKLPLHESINLSQNGGTDIVWMGDILKMVGLEHLADREQMNVVLGKEFDGIELSEGEWQKLAVARCMYKNAGLVVLDEPTGALDPLSEQKILNDFIAISKGKTSVIITHRLGICRKVDQIVVLDHGRVVQQGSHDELMSQEGLYRQMFQDQQVWYEK